MSRDVYPYGTQIEVPEEGLRIGTVVGGFKEVGPFWVAVTNQLMVELKVKATTLGGIQRVSDILPNSKNLIPGELVRSYGVISEFPDLVAPGIIGKLNDYIGSHSS